MNKIDAKNTIEKLAERFDYRVEGYNRCGYNDTMLQLNKDLHATTLPEQKEQLQARIKYTDKKIDKLVI
jgi:hypothetical protein